ncbi:MAG: hypothetical protein IKK66_02780 [Ruminococcus sp.]|nr:hypothetical protein [Ruminococcus sp.]
MKKISRLFLIITAAALTGCSDKNTDSEPVVVSSKTADPESITFSWQETYENKIKEFKSSEQYTENSAFDIFDVTGEGTPELIISADSEPTSKCLIYSYDTDSLAEIGEAGNCGTFTYCPETNIIRDEYHGNGFVLGKILEYSNGSFSPVLSYSDNSESASMGAEIYHEVDGINLSLTDYEKALEPYADTLSIDVGRRFTMGDSAINYGIRFSESWKAVLNSDHKKLCREKLNEKLAEIQESGADAGFDLCDLNGDKIPELIISDSSAPEATCSVYYFSQGELAAMEGTYGAHGVFSLDTEKFVFFADTETDKKYWSIANSAFSAADYKESDSIAVIGRKYNMSESGISAVFK